MVPKLKSDTQLRDLLARFFPVAAQGVCKSPEEFADALNSALSGSGRARMVNGVTFSISEQVEGLHSEIVQRSVKLLGTKAGDEKEVSERLWKSLAQSLTAEDGSGADPVTTFVSDIAELAGTSRLYLAPNHVLRLNSPVDRIEIGPVVALTGEKAIEELRARNQNPRWTATVGQPGLAITGEGTTTLNVADQCWLIEAIAAKGHLAEEAIWLASIAISLLRLTALNTFAQRAPAYGDVEPHPIHPQTDTGWNIIIEEEQITSEGFQFRHVYHATADTLAYCKGDAFREITASVFEAGKGSVGERFAQGLGWLARGRQSVDRAERFLYFFTAVEALLSSNDKSAPVVQTIARHIASILSQTPEERAKNAKMVRELYGARSALVHSGARGVSKTDAQTIQIVAESLFWNVLKKVDLTERLFAFHDELQLCSYGLPWRAESPDRLAGLAPDATGSVD